MSKRLVLVLPLALLAASCAQPVPKVGTPPAPSPEVFAVPTTPEQVSNVDREEAALRETLKGLDWVRVDRFGPEVDVTFRSAAVFDGSTATVLEYADAVIKKIAGILVDPPNTRIQVLSFTDSSGDEAAQKKRTTDRSGAVKDRLAAHGIPAARLSSEGMGAVNFVADNESEAGRHLNQRIVVKVIPAGK